MMTEGRALLKPLTLYLPLFAGVTVATQFGAGMSSPRGEKSLARSGCLWEMTDATTDHSILTGQVLTTYYPSVYYSGEPI